MNVLSLLKNAVKQAFDDIKDLGGTKNLRGNLGVEDHFRWRIMYHLEEEIKGSLFQSLEIKLGHPPQRKQQPQFDLGLFKIQSHTNKSLKSIEPVLICELKMTGYAQLFEGKKEVKKDFTRLIEVFDFLSDKTKIPQFFGLVYYIETPSEIKTFMAKQACPDLWNQSTELMSNRYFEIVVRQQEDHISLQVLNEPN